MCFRLVWPCFGEKDGVNSPRHRGASREPRRWPRRVRETESTSLELERFNGNLFDFFLIWQAGIWLLLMMLTL
jgi:hypothetical protein